MSPGKSEGLARTQRLRGGSSLTSLALVLAASAMGCERGDYTLVSDSSAGAGAGGGSGSVGAGGVPGTAGSLGLAGAFTPPQPPCSIAQPDVAIFADRYLSSDAPARRELFTWTTAEQVAELRDGSRLFTRTEREGLGPGYAMQALRQLTQSTDTTPEGLDNKALAELLIGPAFDKARYAWTDPWATRVGWPGEDYGDRLVRILLREEAWLARYTSGVLDVIDMNNQPVPTLEALAHPERIAGLYFVRDAGSGGPYCGGSFSGGDNGYREFIVGNEAMVEEWSVGTAELRARIEADIERVQAFFERVRPCPSPEDAQTWNNRVVCSWGSSPQTSELGAYEDALAIPSANYLPTTSALAQLIEALQASLFEPDPLIVEPARPE